MHKQKILFKHLENGAEKWYNNKVEIYIVWMVVCANDVAEVFTKTKMPVPFGMP